jgi:hypothetical protein
MRVQRFRNPRVPDEERHRLHAWCGARCGVLPGPADRTNKPGADWVAQEGRFYEYPRLIRLSDGAVEFSLPGISSGVQARGLIHHHEALPPLAFDPQRRRFPNAWDDKIHVVSITFPGSGAEAR